ncbi:MAG: hypothetical protein KC944_22525, partial [Candidatus Omnitrophica bacterium]|nr:hypothetical protein [Candidatus Omnitrophota bacterium]
FLSTVALATLTTPIQYLTDTQAMTDIFTKGLQAPVPGFEDGQPMLYLNYQEFVRFMQFGTEPVFDAWMVLSFGPNLKFESFAPNTPSIAYAPYPGWDVDPRFADNAYNPTNGLRSDGDIMKGGGPQMPAKAKLLLGFQ